MDETLLLKPVAHIENAFDTKFGIPRQARLTHVLSKVTLEKEYQKEGVFKALDGFSHIWLLFGFTGFYGKTWSSTIRPPRLGGNEYVGVFASRSPHRPNPIGMSAVKIIRIEQFSIVVEGADLMNRTPVYDIKPYIPYADSVSDAKEGYAPAPVTHKLEVIVPAEIRNQYDESFLDDLIEILQLDPRPAYIDDENRVYGFSYQHEEVKFKVKGDQLTVLSIDHQSPLSP